MAKELGYYDKVGINLNILEFQNNTKLSNILEENKDIQFAIGRSSLLIDKSNGRDIVLLGAILQDSPLMLLVREDSNINSIKDFKNKKIMITQDAGSTASIKAMLNSNNIFFKDLTLQNHSFDLNDLINKKTDAMASYISNEPIRLKDKGINYKIFHPKDYGFDFYSDILFTTNSFLKNNPQLTKDFYEASIKGWTYAFKNIEETAKIIHNKYNSQKLPLSHLIKEGKSLRNLAFHEGSTKIGCLDKDKIENIIATYKVLGLIKNEIDLKNTIYKHNGHKSVSIKLSGDEIYKYPIIIISTIIVFIVFLFLFVINRKWLHTKRDLEEEIKLKTKEIEKLTFIDSLTQINNRRAYDKDINELLSLYTRYGNSFSIAMFDIDDFKVINDNYGHDVGDIVLKDLTQIILKNVRENDKLYRVGGEEFVILFPLTKLAAANKVCEKLLVKIDRDLKTIHNHNVTVSIGITSVSDDDNFESLYKRVDKYLYKAKRNGKNQIQYDK